MLHDVDRRQGTLVNGIEQWPRVGVAAIVRHRGKVLLGKRRGSHGEGTWALPGGHLEFGEAIEACVEREVREETGLIVTNVQFGTITNDIFIDEGRHYVTIFMVCDYADGTLTVMEPDKCDAWRWCGWDEIPRPMFLPLANLLTTTFDPFATAET
jgi:8-oxo-dGTP diphosphatase